MWSIKRRKKKQASRHHIHAEELSRLELNKTPKRSEVINYLISVLSRPCTYLEIGVRDPSKNFDIIKAEQKYGVDPGLEFKDNPVEFAVTSDKFFEGKRNGEFLPEVDKFDIVFIDGLHTAEQVDKDIRNALDTLAEDGFIVLHDCNPPTEWHARETRDLAATPAGMYWNGSTWKGFLKWRFNPDVYSCCIDTDWGVGIISPTHQIGSAIENTNPFYEFSIFNDNRKSYLNLIGFDELKNLLKSQLKEP